MTNLITTKNEYLSFNIAVQRDENDNITNIRIVGKEIGKNILIFDTLVSKIVQGVIKPEMTQTEIVHVVTVAIQRIMAKWTDELILKLNWEPSW